MGNNSGINGDLKSSSTISGKNFLSFEFGEKGWINRHLACENRDGLVNSVITGKRLSLALHHTKNATVNAFSDPSERFQGVVWGVCFDIDDGARATAIKTILAALASGNFSSLNRVGGLFVAVVLDRQQDQLHLITDCLGVRPFFVTRQKGIVYGASHALSLTRFLAHPARASLDAISQYFTFGFNATNQSLVEGIDRLDSAAHVVWDHEKKQVESYGRVTALEKPVGHLEMADRVHHIVSRSYKNWTQGAAKLTLGLSGGYDSRFLCALSTTFPPITRYINMESQLSETILAREVAERLGIPLEIIPTCNNDWDDYAPESIFHCRPDGFPVTKSLSRLIFRQAPTTPLVDGYLGDALVRGHLDNMLGRPEDPADGTAALAVLQKASIYFLDIFRPKVRQSMTDRAYAAALSHIAGHQTEGHVITAFDIFMRQRSYISNNFLQNINEMEPCLPFLDPELIALKLSHPYADFGIATYDEIFRRHVPPLAGLQHNKDLDVVEPANNISRVQRRWAFHALPAYLVGGGNGILDKGFLLPRLSGALALRRCGYIITPLAFLDMLREIALRHNILIDWDALTG